MKASRIVAIGLVAAAAAWIASGHLIPHETAESRAAIRPGEAAAQKPFRVAVAEANVIPHARKLTLSGRTEADRKVMVTARTGGMLKELRVKRGQQVAQGEVIAVLSDDAREAQVAQARAIYHQRKTELDARRKLIEQGTLPKLELVNLESQLKVAEAALAGAEAERERGIVQAPWAGVITDVPSEVGGAAFSMAGKEIAQMVALDPMLAVVEVSERKFAGIKLGDFAEVRLVSGQTARGRVRFVSRSASPATRTYRVEVEIKNTDGAIPDGITAEVAIPMAPVAAARVPRSALTFSSTGDLGVRIVGAEDKVMFVPVGVVEDEQNFMWVAGLPDKAQVIVQGQDFVREGQQRAGFPGEGCDGGKPVAGRSEKQEERPVMFRLIDYAISHARLTIATLIFLLLAGFVAYQTIPKEAEPDVKIPIIYTQLTQRGISPEDAERLLLRPVETQLKSVGNVKEMRSTAYEGGGFILLEFEAGFDSKAALADVRAKVDQAKRDLPKDADEPSVQEVNLSLYPVLVVALAGDMPERSMLRIARTAKNAIEQVPGVLSAELRGARDEAVEIIVEPMLLRSYNIPLDQLIAGFNASNTLIAAGALEGQTGRFAIKVPGLIERPQDMLNMPVVASPGATVTISDIAQIKPTFKDATSVTRVNGKPAMTIEVSKRTGANLIETVDGVKAAVEQLKRTWPEAVQVTYTQDKSKIIRQMLTDLQNSVATGVLLVAVIMLFALGFRASLFIGIAIPASFLAGVLGLQLAGLTVNIVVLFSLILAVGMLVDDAIIVSEFAERRMSEGMPAKEAYSLAAKRMSGPVIAATATRVAAFSPLLFWPGVVGEFMKYMPITLIATLSASLAVALFFTPTLGALLGKAAAHPHRDRVVNSGPYMRTVRLALHHPGATLAAAAFLLVAVIALYGKVGRGVEFFPDVEPDYGQVIVHGRGSISLEEKNRALSEVEKRVLEFDGLQTVYTRIGEQPRGSNEISEDTIGVIQFEFANWQKRDPAHKIMDAIRDKTADIPGILVEVTAPRAGPPTGKPIQVQIGALDPEKLPQAATKVAALLAQHAGYP